MSPTLGRGGGSGSASGLHSASPTSSSLFSSVLFSPTSGAVPLAIGIREALPEMMIYEAGLRGGGGEGGGLPLRRSRRGAFLSLPDLLQFATQSDEDLLLDVIAPAAFPRAPPGARPEQPDDYAGGGGAMGGGAPPGPFVSASASRRTPPPASSPPAWSQPPQQPLQPPQQPPQPPQHESGGVATAAPQLLQLGVKLLPLPQQLGSSFLLAISPRVVLLNRTSRPLVCCQRGGAAQTLLPPCASAAAATLPRGSATASSTAGLLHDQTGWVAVHWEDPTRPREMLLRRLDRDAKWSGGVPLSGAAARDAHVAAGAEMMLRLRRKKSAHVDFLRLTWHRLTSRATSVLVVTDASELGAPLLVQNLTRYPLHFRQVGVAVHTSVGAGELVRYAWDEPARKQELSISVQAWQGVRFRVGAVPCRLRRPLFASLLRRPCLELEVRTEGAATRFVLRDATSTNAPPLSPLPMSPPPLREGSGAAGLPAAMSLGGGGGGGGAGGGGGGRECRPAQSEAGDTSVAGGCRWRRPGCGGGGGHHHGGDDFRTSAERICRVEVCGARRRGGAAAQLGCQRPVARVWRVAPR